MKLNKRGFAVTSIIYSMLVLFLALVLLVISNLASRKVLFDKEKNEILDKIFDYNWQLKDYDNDGLIDFGEELTYKTESFYVMGIDGDQLILLSKYRINTESKIQHTSVEHSNGMIFSSTSYWYNSSENKCLYSTSVTNYNGTSSCPRQTYIYDGTKTSETADTAIDYVAAYGNNLKNLGAIDNVTNDNVRLMKYEEANALGCKLNTGETMDNNCKSAPIWVWKPGGDEVTNSKKSSGYWLGSYAGFLLGDDGMSYHRIWSIDSDGSFDRPAYQSDDKYHGVRPVIEISKNIISLEVDLTQFPS